MPKDSKNIAKIVIVDEKQRVLFLKRSAYSKKYANEWDLPGGHVKEKENLIVGLKREVLEETSINIANASYFDKKGNTHFFYSVYNGENISLSDEHTDYIFFDKSYLKKSQKYQKIALRVLDLLEEQEK